MNGFVSLAFELEVNKADPRKLTDHKTQRFINNERTVKSERPQGREDSLVAQLDSAVNQTEQLQQVRQQYSVYVQRKCGANRPAAIYPGAALTSEQAQLQAILQRALACAALG
jgi:hypothetical protein